MKIIARLVEMMKEELEDSEKYAICALEYKTQFPKLAQRFHDLANGEMQHMRTLHSEAERMIQELRDEEGDPSPEMLAIYNWEHERLIKKAASVKSIIEEFDE